MYQFQSALLVILKTHQKLVSVSPLTIEGPRGSLWCNRSERDYGGVLDSIFLCWCMCMVPNWRQLNIVASNWGSYLVCSFSHLQCGILFCMCALRISHHYIFVVLRSFTIIKMWNSTHAAPWSNYLSWQRSDSTASFLLFWLVIFCGWML